MKLFEGVARVTRQDGSANIVGIIGEFCCEKCCRGIVTEVVANEEKGKFVLTMTFKETEK